MKEARDVSTNPLYAALDLGSTKIVAIVGHSLEDGQFEIVGLGVAPTGMAIRNGTIVDVQHAVGAINRAIDQVQRLAGRPVRNVVVGFAGGEVVGVDQRVTIALRDREVQAGDIEKVLQEARSMVNRPASEILHVIPKTYTIDDLSNIPNPIGMVGARLEAQVHVIKGSEMVIANLKRTVERAGLVLRDGDLILQPLAGARVLLSEDDKELGVALVDIGGGTTNMAVYVNGALAGIRVFPFGGINMTKDLAIVRRVSQEEAERIKIETLTREDSIPAGPDAPSSSGSFGGEQASLVMEIVEARLAEILTLVAREIKEMRLESRLQRGIVLTGGVASMPQVVPFAQKILSPLHVTVGSVKNRIQGLVDRSSGPEFSSAVGLLYYARDHWGDVFQEDTLGKPREEHETKKKEPLVTSSRLWNWIREII